MPVFDKAQPHRPPERNVLNVQGEKAARVCSLVGVTAAMGCSSSHKYLSSKVHTPCVLGNVSTTLHSHNCQRVGAQVLRKAGWGL